MPLCDLCRIIPWEYLPTVPPNILVELSGLPYIQSIHRWPQDVRGHPYHQSLAALRQSASSCGLCSIICESVENVQKEHEEAKLKWEAGEMKQYDWPTWEMWLVKRREGGDGCWVMSFVDGNGPTGERRKKAALEEARIVAAIGICVRDGDVLDSVIQGRTIEELGGAPATIERARRWLAECNEHPTCKPSETYLPSRVLDVGELDSPEARLWAPVPQGTSGKYISLSYCWGTSQEFTTTRSTLEARKQGITIADMPTTYQDIIKLTRALGVRYLWVDSLCICQDEHADWERESAKMLSIYSNAYLTVSATRAKESAEGFLGPRPIRTYVQLDYNHNSLQGTALAFSLPLREELDKRNYVTLPHEPLSKRAWALQERVLSHRMLLYGTTQMYYECNEGYRGEDGLSISDRHDCVHKSLDYGYGSRKKVHLRMLEGVKINTRPKHNILRGWYDLLWLYGPKKLTRASDKLPAISGLASLYAGEIDEEYLAGLWRGQLIEGLMWENLNFRRVSEYRAPSWSWASGDGIPAAGMEADYTELAEILDARVTLKGTNPFGEVSDGWIKLRAPVEQLHLILDGWDPEAPGHSPHNNNIKVRTIKGDPKGVYSRFDFADMENDAPQEAKKIVQSLDGVDIFALMLLKARSWLPEASEDEGRYYSLIVRKVQGTENYQRLGCLLCDESMFGWKPEEQPKEELSTFTLV